MADRDAVRRVVPSVLALVACLTATSGCTTDAGPEEVRVAVGDLAAVPATALDLGAATVVGLPSGLLSVRVAPDVDAASTDEIEVTPQDDDTTLVGVAWSFETQPSSEARAVMLDGGELTDLPQPVVTVVDGDRSVGVPVAASAGVSGAAVVGVGDATALTVDFDGVTQTVDLATGTVGTGPTEAFVDLAAGATTVREVCPAEDFPRAAVLDLGCGVEAVYALPWIAGLGWAGDGASWLVVDARVTGRATVTVDGDPGTPLESAPDGIRRLAFGPGATSGRVDFDFGADIGVVSVPLPD